MTIQQKYKGMNMKKAIDTLTGWIGTFNELLKALIVFGVIVGILYSDVFGVIKGIGNLMGQIGDAGLSGLVALALIATWYKK
tara:strand:- start:469 stop:714 length:246 start_codon:yes stop_codon:yes gene_type:complete